MMKKLLRFSVFVILAAIFVVGSMNGVFAQKKPLLKMKCCIAGSYKGEHKDLPSRTCKEPGSGTFTMEIHQDRGCGAKIRGEITGSDGSVMKFEGMVKPARGKCCTITGKASNPGETVEFKGILCKKGKKWYTKEGKYKHSNGCTGTFSMEQI
jgi:hypothetical protein